MTFFFKFFPFRSSRRVRGELPVATAPLLDFLIVAKEMGKMGLDYSNKIVSDPIYFF